MKLFFLILAFVFVILQVSDYHLGTQCFSLLQTSTDPSIEPHVSSTDGSAVDSGDSGKKDKKAKKEKKRKEKKAKKEKEAKKSKAEEGAEEEGAEETEDKKGKKDKKAKKGKKEKAKKDKKVKGEEEGAPEEGTVTAEERAVTTEERAVTAEERAAAAEDKKAKKEKKPKKEKKQKETKAEKEARKQREKEEKLRAKQQKEEEKRLKKLKKAEEKKSGKAGKGCGAFAEKSPLEEPDLVHDTCKPKAGTHLATMQFEVLAKASQMRFSRPDSFTHGYSSSILGLDDNLDSLIANEAEEISKLSSELAVYNVRVTRETKELLLELDNTIKLDEQYKNEVVSVVKGLDVNRKCSKELVRGAGSLLVNLQGKNDVLYAKSLLLTKLINRENEANQPETEEILRFKDTLFSHQKVINIRLGYISDLSAAMLVCQKRDYIPKQIVCAPTSNYLPNPRECTTEDLVNLMERMIFNIMMRFTENSYLQSCSDRVSTCKDLCSNGDVSCLECFTSSLCERIHLFRKHSYGKDLVNTANKAYECETYLHLQFKKNEANNL